MLQEDAALSARVAKYGTKSWTTIAAGVEGRSAVSVQTSAKHIILAGQQCPSPAPASPIHAGQLSSSLTSAVTRWSTPMLTAVALAPAAAFVLLFPPSVSMDVTEKLPPKVVQSVVPWREAHPIQ